VGALGLYTPGPVRSTVHTAFLHCSFYGGFIGPPRPKRRPAGSSHKAVNTDNITVVIKDIKR